MHTSDVRAEHDAWASVVAHMAWRIESYVIRGEIDNRERDRVVGRLWVVGRAQPIEIDLRGNAARDLAGRRLEFVNPDPQPGLDELFAQRQTGPAGEVTASRKVRVQDRPAEGAGTLPDASSRWHWSNSVYFEWFSEANGRVVIESAAFRLTIDPDIRWELAGADSSHEPRSEFPDTYPAYENSEGEILAEGSGFELGGSEDFEGFGDFPSGDEWMTERPMTEAEADALMDDSDRLTERLLSRLRNAKADEDLETILEEEIERASREQARPYFPTDEAERLAWLDELKRRAEEIVQPNPSVFLEKETAHPLSIRASALALVFGEPIVGTSTTEFDPDELELRHAVTEAAGKLSGALDGRPWPPPISECALCIAWLKRARYYYDQAARAAVLSRKRASSGRERLDYLYGEILSIRCEVEVLIEHFRERLRKSMGES